MNFGGSLAALLAFLNLPQNNDLIRYSWRSGGLLISWPVDPGHGLGGGSEGQTQEALQILHSVNTDIAASRPFHWIRFGIMYIYIYIWLVCVEEF